MKRDEYMSNIESILKYAGNYSSSDLTALLLASDAARVKKAFDNHPAELSNPNIIKIAKILTSVLPGLENGGNAKFSHEIINDFVNFLSGKEGEVIEEDKKLLQECIRITPMNTVEGDENVLKYIINNTSLYDDKKWKDANTNEYTLLQAVKLPCHDSFSKINDIPTKQKPRCSIIEILKPGLGASARDTKEVAIFTNMVTSLEMSRCVPFMRLKIIPPKYVDNQGQPVRMPPYFNIIGFLRGDKVPLESSTLRPADAELSMTMGDMGKVDGGGSMELFTVPQTMMTPRSNLGNFSNTILDRSRPFMTVTNVKISVKPAAGWYTFKTATIDLVLHDRSRLGEIAPFIKPDIFAGANKSTFEIEYGWSHPDGDRKVGDRLKNPIGAFLNGLRCLENYEVYNATYSFAESGQVNISLQLTMKSHSSILAQSPTITDVKESITALTKMTEEINLRMKIATGGNEKQMSSLKEIFPEILMTGAGSADSAMSMDLTKFAELQSKLNDIKVSATSAQTKELSLALSELLTKAKSAQDNASNAAEKKITNLSAGVEIFPASLTNNGQPSKSVKIPTTISPATKTTISLGRILHAYVAAPLASTNEFAEVQLIFGLHNDRASFMRSLSIARHPIDSDAFKKEVTEFMKKKPKMTISEFIGMLNEKFISNTAAFAHGFSNAQPKKTSNGDQTKEDVKSHDLQSKIIAEDARITDGNYRPPSLQLTTECVKSNSGELILRIFIFDGSATIHQTYVDLLRAARDVSSNIVNTSGIDSVHPLLPKAPEVRSLGKSKEALIKFLTEKGALSGASKEAKPAPGESEKAVKVSAMALVEDASKLKSVISKGFPYIRYGQGSGAITSIGASSLSDPGLANAALSAAGQNTPYTAANADQFRGIPMRVTPADLSLEMLGCPILNTMQNFFIDLDTQTTLDGIYTISGIEHSLSPGSFNTSVKLINTSDGYMSFRSAGNDLSSTISKWLQEDPDAKAAVQKANTRRSASQQASQAKADQGRAAAAALLQAGVDAANAEILADVVARQMESWQLIERKAKVLPIMLSWGKKIAAENGYLYDSAFVDDLQRMMENAIEIRAYTGTSEIGSFIDFVVKKWFDGMVKVYDTDQDSRKYNSDKYESYFGESFKKFGSLKSGSGEYALADGYRLHDVDKLLWSVMKKMADSTTNGDSYEKKLKEVTDKVTKDREKYLDPEGQSESA